MAQSITVDIRAQVSGYEASLKQFQQACDKLNPGSGLQKNVKTALDAAEKQLNGLYKNLTPQASSDTQIDRIVEKTNQVGESLRYAADLMKNLTFQDLDISKADSELGKFQQEIVNLNNELHTLIDTGLQDFLNKSVEIKNVFSDVLKVDTAGKGQDELFSALAEGAEKAKAKIQEVDAELERISKRQFTQENKLEKEQSGPLASLAGKDQLTSQIENIKQEYTKSFETLRNQLAENLKNKLGESSKLQPKELLDNFFGGLTPENIRQKIYELYNSLNDAGIYNKKRDFYNEIFGGGRDVNSIVKQIDFRDPQALKDRLTEIVNSLASDIGGKNKAIITELINSGEIDTAAETTLKNIDTAYGKVQNRIQKLKDEINNLIGDKERVSTSRAAAEDTQRIISDATKRLEQEVARLTRENETLTQRISQLEATVNQRENASVSSVQEQINKAAGNTTQWTLSAEAVAQYKNELAQVHEREQLVGRVEGVVQRWFSIYAAVRMVGNAIRSVISTIKELDATITEIAIVTDMSQSDLWGQMDRYTEMARSYAASISGVYQVSQLYYQQGKLNI